MSSRPSEPWASLLADIEAHAPEPMTLTCIGGFAVSQHYGLVRPTGDIDVVDVTPAAVRRWLADFAAEGSPRHRKHKVYLQLVGVASLPYGYEDRVGEIFAGSYERLRLFVLDPCDLVLSKLSRNSDVDREDVKHLALSAGLDLVQLERRYRDELRPYLVGPITRHDATMLLWLEMLREAAGR